MSASVNARDPAVCEQPLVSNHDIGFIHKDVEIKIDTFNFTRYG